jgi:hypothetical protein
MPSVIHQHQLNAIVPGLFIVMLVGNASKTNGLKNAPQASSGVTMGFVIRLVLSNAIAGGTCIANLVENVVTIPGMIPAPVDFIARQTVHAGNSSEQYPQPCDRIR